MKKKVHKLTDNGSDSNDIRYGIFCEPIGLRSATFTTTKLECVTCKKCLKKMEKK